jgi:hypothetical protein
VLVNPHFPAPQSPAYPTPNRSPLHTEEAPCDLFAKTEPPVAQFSLFGPNPPTLTRQLIPTSQPFNPRLTPPQIGPLYTLKRPPVICSQKLSPGVTRKCDLHLGSPIQTSTDGIAGCLMRDDVCQVMPDVPIYFLNRKVLWEFVRNGSMSSQLTELWVGMFWSYDPDILITT